MDAKNFFLQFNRDSVIECGRHLKNLSEKKFTLSRPNSAVYVEPADIFFNGENGDLVVKAPVEKYVSKEITRNPNFFPKEVEFNQIPTLSGMMDNMERELQGKTMVEVVEEMDLAEKLEKFPHLVQELMAIATPLEAR